MAVRTWGAGTGPMDGLWSTATNWTGDAVPGVSDDVVFDATDVTNCTIDATVSVNDFTITGSGYTGTITNTTYGVTIAGNYLCKGIYLGGSADHGISGDCTFDDATTVGADGGTGIWTIAGSLVVEADASTSLLPENVTMTGTSKNVQIKHVNSFGSNVCDITVDTGATITFTKYSYGILLGHLVVKGTATMGGGTHTNTNTFYFHSVSVESGAEINGAQFSSPVPQNDGTISLSRIELEGSAAIYMDSGDYVNTTFRTNMGSSGYLVFAAGDVYFGSLDVTLPSYSWQTISNSTNNPNLHFSGGIITDSNGYRINWNAGTGTVYFSGTGTYKIMHEIGSFEDVVINGTGSYSVEKFEFECRSLTVSNGTFSTAGFDLVVTEAITISDPAVITASGLNGSTWNCATLSINGVSGTLITLNATADWYINCAGANTITYVNLAYCRAVDGSGVNLLALNSTDSGSNSGISFNDDNRYWMSDIASTWNSTANWSYHPDGVSGSTVPAATKNVYIGSWHVGDCTIDVNAVCNFFYLQSGYTGTVTNNNFTFDSTDWMSFNAKYLGGSGSHTLGGNYTIETTTTSDMGTGIWTCAGNWTVRATSSGSAGPDELVLIGVSKTIDIYVTDYNIDLTIDTGASYIMGRRLATTTRFVDVVIRGNLNLNDFNSGWRLSTHHLAVTSTGSITGGSGGSIYNYFGLTQMDGTINVLHIAFYSGNHIHTIPAGDYVNTFFWVTAVNNTYNHILFSAGTTYFGGMYYQSLNYNLNIDNDTNNPNLVMRYGMQIHNGNEDWITWHPGTGTITYTGGSGARDISLHIGSFEDTIIDDTDTAFSILYRPCSFKSLTIRNGSLDSNDLNISITEGDLVVESGGTYINSAGNSLLQFTGTGAQAIDDQTVSQVLDTVYINKASGTTTFTSDILAYNLNLVQGLLDINGKDITTTTTFVIGIAGQLVPTGLNGCTWNVGTDCTLTGEAGDLINMVATAVWYYKVAGVSNIDYIDVAYSDATDAYNRPVPSNSVDSDDNIRWGFAQDVVSSFNITPDRNGVEVISTIELQGIVDRIQGKAVDTEFDATTDIIRVISRYDHEDGRQKKLLVHVGSPPKAKATWATDAHTGVWKLSYIKVIGKERAYTELNRVDIDIFEDLTFT